MYFLKKNLFSKIKLNVQISVASTWRHFTLLLRHCPAPSLVCLFQWNVYLITRLLDIIKVKYRSHLNLFLNKIACVISCALFAYGSSILSAQFEIESYSCLESSVFRWSSLFRCRCLQLYWHASLKEGSSNSPTTVTYFMHIYLTGWSIKH